jgi:hypothetical protein
LNIEWFDISCPSAEPAVTIVLHLRFSLLSANDLTVAFSFALSQVSKGDQLAG